MMLERLSCATSGSGALHDRDNTILTRTLGRQKMSKFHGPFFIFAATALLAMPALAQQPSSPAMSNMASPADKAFSTDMDKMNQRMSSAPMSGNADQDFVSMMLPHHMGAVEMAKVELRYGKDPVLRKMAHDIIASQNKEISEMHAWQASHPMAK